MVGTQQTQGNCPDLFLKDEAQLMVNLWHNFITSAQIARKFWIWTTPNFVGLFCYLYLSSFTWPTVEKGYGLIMTGNQAFFWGLYAFPILVLMFLINGDWLILAMIRKHRQR